jgi:hypothetical protein
VGPGYFYFKGVTNRTAPANRYQHDEEQADPADVWGQAAGDSQEDEERREVLHVFIFSESAVVMGSAFQKVFLHVRAPALGVWQYKGRGHRAWGLNGLGVHTCIAESAGGWEQNCAIQSARRMIARQCLQPSAASSPFLQYLVPLK